MDHLDLGSGQQWWLLLWSAMPGVLTNNRLLKSIISIKTPSYDYYHNFKQYRRFSFLGVVNTRAGDRTIDLWAD